MDGKVDLIFDVKFSRVDGLRPEVGDASLLRNLLPPHDFPLEPDSQTSFSAGRRKSTSASGVQGVRRLSVNHMVEGNH